MNLPFYMMSLYPILLYIIVDTTKKLGVSVISLKRKQTYFRLYIHIYVSIHHWRIFWNSYGKLAWVGLELTTTEFHSDALTN